MLSELEKDMLCDWIWGRISSMEMMILTTRAEGVEQARSFCKRNDKFEDTPFCSGTECAVSPPKCPPDTKQVGGVHTHPQGVDEFSPSDYIYSINSGEAIHCLATVKKSTLITETGDVARKQNIIKCERLNLPIAEKTPRLHELLKEADSKANSMKVAASLGGDYMEEYQEYKTKMREFNDEAKKAGFIGRCNCPEFMGVWERTIERRPVKEV